MLEVGWSFILWSMLYLEGWSFRSSYILLVWPYQGKFAHPQFGCKAKYTVQNSDHKVHKTNILQLLVVLAFTLMNSMMIAFTFIYKSCYVSVASLCLPIPLTHLKVIQCTLYNPLSQSHINHPQNMQLLINCSELCKKYHLPSICLHHILLAKRIGHECLYKLSVVCTNSIKHSVIQRFKL